MVRAIETTPGRWEHDGAVARLSPRPDGKGYLRLPDDRRPAWPALVAAVVDAVPCPLLVHVDGGQQGSGAADIGASAGAGAGAPDPPAVLEQLGFVVTRSEQHWRIPVPVPTRSVATGRHRLLPVTDADPGRATDLDNTVRHDIPGTERWQGTTADFVAGLDDEELDPRLYLVAENTRTGEYDGLVRVWWRDPVPRVGCLGVRPAWRRTRLAAMLASAVATRLRERGASHVTTETDLRNRHSFAMARGLGGVPTHVTTEWERPGR